MKKTRLHKIDELLIFTDDISRIFKDILEDAQVFGFIDGKIHALLREMLDQRMKTYRSSIEKLKLTDEV